MAAVVDGDFSGALSTIDAGKGYWIVANESFVFEYNDPSGLPRLADEEPPVTEELYYVNTINQYFYFIETATIEGVEVREGDWVVAYNGDVVVGSESGKPVKLNVYGQLGIGVKYPQESLEVDGNIKFAERTFASGEQEPSDGRWNTGSIVWNEKPSINKSVGWVCVIGGKPGNWRPFGLIL